MAGVGVVLAIVVGIGGCARHGEWRRIEAGSCAPAAPPRVCVLAGPDAPQVVKIGAAALVPGECAQGSGGDEKVVVRVRDGRDGRESARRLRLRRGETAMLAAPAGEIAVYERRACGRGS